MDIYSELHNYGWIVVLLFVVVRETIPTMMKYLMPERAARVRHQNDIEERNVMAVERIAENTDATRAAVAAINVYMQTLNVRLSKIETALETSNRSLAIVLDRIDEELNS